MTTRVFSISFLSKIRQFSTGSEKRQFRKMANYKVRSFRKEDIPDIVKVAKQSTFQYSVESLQSWSKHDPDGIKVAELDSGEVVGLCASVNHNDKFSFGGTFCVLEKYRQMEIGHKLFSACFEHAGSRNIGLNCPNERMNSYKRRGFEIFEETFSILEYEYFGPCKAELLSDQLPEGVELKKFENSHLDAIFAYDLSMVGYDRRVILEASFNEADTKTFVAFKNSVCVGFGAVKLNIFENARVGPLYANDPALAEVMFRRLLEAFPDAKGLAMTTLSNNFSANENIKRLGIPVHDNLLRLYTKEKLKVNTSKIYAQFDVDFSPF
ncbi:hypothetical protein CDAR_614402 [Caerostris darwini]|uniref:N-acetyltransferase domain-containing protein n=1 Tax=Caerostris darwini TaxID=1538125 RepID=A0AAV4NPD3_9ARAC|nr:hypothetical protein CDAR_614402 [Caerostris darwini]